MTAPALAPSWSLPGLADDVVLAAGRGRLWIAASSATLAAEEVWLGAIAPDGVAWPVAVLPGAACCRPAITGLGGDGPPDRSSALGRDGALAIACVPDGRIAGACHRGGEAVVRWQLATEATPVHAAAAAAGDLAWIAVELARGGERTVLVAAIDPDTGAVHARHHLGGGATWCRWPALAAHGGDILAAWCEGPARAAGRVRIARWPGRRDADLRRAHAHARGLTASADPSADRGDAPALAALGDGRIAVAWHRGGPSDAGDARDASVVRAIDAAIVDLDTGAVAAATPPAGAGGAEPRGDDQGWELPALAVDGGGALWLVGRSTHGHHLARREPDGVWRGPAALGPPGWGGRGRRHALAVHAGDVWLARRAPDGIAIARCTPPSAMAPAIAPASAPATDAAAAAASATARSARPRHRPPRPGRRVLFGDLHQHTAHSDGCGSFEDLWIAARDRRGLDFAAITDHDQFCRRALGPATWRTACHVAAGFDDPGRFVALAAYEFTGPRHPGPGHKCVYFGDRVPDRVPDKDVASLFAVVRALGGIAVPHHVAWTGGDFGHHDPAIQPVWEICSVHGCYEAEGACASHPPRADHVIPGQFVRDALDAGLRFGFIGSTDSHGLDWHHGIARWRNPFRSGLACLVGADPTRAGILTALRARRSYATTGAKIGLRVELDGAVMGEELPAGTRGELLVEIDGTAPVTRIALVHSRGELTLDHQRHGHAATARAPVPALDPPGYLYVRIEQADGEAAWASPFWIGR